MKTLSDIIKYKKKEVNIKKKLLTLTQIKEESANYIPTRPFLKQIESNKSKISIISEIKKGNMVLLMDDEDRENEGDLILAGEKVTVVVALNLLFEICGVGLL